MRKIRVNHMNFVISPNIVCKRTSIHVHYKLYWVYKPTRVRETLHLLNHNDVGSQHLKTSGEVHNIGPAKNQSPSHRHELFCYSGGAQHTQNHNQSSVANPATKIQIQKEMKCEWMHAVKIVSNVLMPKTWQFFICIQSSINYLCCLTVKNIWQLFHFYSLDRLRPYISNSEFLLIKCDNKNCSFKFLLISETWE